ncbi:signal peptidase I [Candidatus Gracilibacteria bacterium]|nr:signal peptidase I [Candidatus Gracilibacteria bacterium]
MCNTLNFVDGQCQKERCRTLVDKIKGTNKYGSESCETIFVNEAVYSFLRDPKRGEIVVFVPPTEIGNGKMMKKKYIKRVIGVPGDIVEIENGKVYLTNEAEGIERQELPESYLSAKNEGRTSTTKAKFEVPEGEYLCFGDNRIESLDARRCYEPQGCDENNTAFVPKKYIKGRAQVVVWPPKQWRGARTGFRNGK